MMENKYILGADIGGSHITVAIMELESQIVLEESVTRRSVNAKANQDHIIEEWCQAIDDSCLKVSLRPERIGIAIPGPFDYENGVSFIQGNNKFEALYQVNIREILAMRLGLNSRSIGFVNDATSFLAGEVFAGLGKGYERVIGITLGTGLGTASYDGKNVHDANLWCAPYLDGIIEDYASTRWFLKRYYEKTGLNIINVKELSALYRESFTVRLIFDEFAGHLADFIDNFQSKAKADAIVIGGNISKAASKFLPSLTRNLCERKVKQPLYISANTELAAIAGTASYWQHL